ncbi:hypothetical protein Pth03_38190 [Planotetraspora thailandica]|uniref:Uncharacterized protein n=1 Tax=Planotetraspora thailandica TaxID=487172 RepID=A0A8J3XWY5_9ACTN|nr:hypothetical protein [Planotetraspora thailandica]GII55430.1 hypothetical protein Pth03_38190 [Planotetraspora thailandica]
MGWLDALLGRTKPAKPDLDALFALPSAAVTLQAATGFTPAGAGSVAFRAAEGGAFAQLERDVKDLLGRVEVSEDTYGYTWLLVRGDDVSTVVTDLHAVNSSLESAGFGPSLLCSLVTFADPAGRTLALVYLYKQGTFYPFAPAGGTRRDNALELQVRGAIEGELRIEPDLSRWFPVWGAPGL